MKKIALVIPIIIISLSFYFCEKDNPTADKGNLVELKIPVATYKYTGYDSMGVKIITGWIEFLFEDSTDITGRWELDKIGDPQNIGPQVGSGYLVGSLENHQLFLNLNPEYVDNNVFLICPYDDQKLTGKWNYSGFPGIINHGTFVAEKK
ncbi:MAG TPA: hypothetical protein VGD14_22515 [bacterium]